jgi:hypothetical protein
VIPHRQVVSARTGKRPWLAVVLALVYPGLGHIYLREWLRALVWFFLVVTGSTLLIPASTVPETLSIGAFMTAAEAIPPENGLALISITFFSMADAYWVAKRRNQVSMVEERTTCPNCGKDLDDDLEFCHWCTERVGTPDHEAEN